MLCDLFFVFSQLDLWISEFVCYLLLLLFVFSEGVVQVSCLYDMFLLLFTNSVLRNNKC